MGVSAIDRRFSKKPISFKISIGNPNAQQPIDSAGEGCPLNITPSYIPKSTNQSHLYLDFKDQIPCFSFQSIFPDSRRRFYNANMIKKLCVVFVSKHCNCNVDLRSAIAYFKIEIFKQLLSMKFSTILHCIQNIQYIN